MRPKLSDKVIMTVMILWPTFFLIFISTLPQLFLWQHPVQFSLLLALFNTLASVRLGWSAVVSFHH